MTDTDFEKLYKAYYMQIYSYLMTLVKNPSAAEEITQQTFFKALAKKESFNNKSKELTWLISIAKNIVADEFRKSSKRAEFDEDKNAVSENFVQEIENRDATLGIHMILHKLSEPYKEVFQLRIFGELSFSEIGKIFGKKEGWARVTYHRAKLMIRERMEKNGY